MPEQIKKNDLMLGFYYPGRDDSCEDYRMCLSVPCGHSLFKIMIWLKDEGFLKRFIPDQTRYFMDRSEVFLKRFKSCIIERDSRLAIVDKKRTSNYEYPTQIFRA